MSPEQSRRPLSIAVMLETGGPGGAESLVHQLCLELRGRGHRMIPVGLEGGEGWLEARFRASGFAHQTFALRRPLDPVALRDLIRLLRREGAEAVHSHEFTMAVYGGAAARWLGLPHVVTMHGDQGVTAAWRRRAALRWAFRQSRAAVAVSDHTRRAMEERLRLRDRTLDVIYNGIPVPQGRREPVRRELGLRDDELLVLAVGSLRPNKGHRLLLEALAALGQGVAPWRLAIAGQGDERDALQEGARRLEIDARVHLLGQRDDVADVQAAADVFAMPSYSEGLPLALLEAMFAGTAIVASDVGGIHEAVRPEQEALLTAPGDVDSIRQALSRLLGDAGLRRSLGAAARMRAHAEFRIARMAERYEALYRGPEPGDPRA